jgi:metal-dependent amidase/aminoacylase/carboxypeptidase family protein
MPHTIVDPMVIAARAVLALQTITSSEVKAGETAVITVRYVHAGTENNVSAPTPDRPLRRRRCGFQRSCAGRGAAGRAGTRIGSGQRARGRAGSASEDFSAYIAEGIPGFFLNLGGADPGKLASALASGTSLPSNHSPFFAPDVDPALHTAITAEVAMLRGLFKADANVPVRRGNGGESHSGVQ